MSCPALPCPALPCLALPCLVTCLCSAPSPPEDGALPARACIVCDDVLRDLLLLLLEVAMVSPLGHGVACGKGLSSPTTGLGGALL